MIAKNHSKRNVFGSHRSNDLMNRCPLIFQPVSSGVVAIEYDKIGLQLFDRIRQ